MATILNEVPPDDAMAREFCSGGLMRPLALSTCVLALTLNACVAPRFAGEHILPPRTPGAPAPAAEPDAIPTAADVVKHVQCELAAILTDNRFPTFQSQKYVVFATLTLEVTNAGGANPTMSFIHPLATIANAPRKRTIGLAGKYVQTAHRTYNQTFVLDLSKPMRGADGKPTYEGQCATTTKGTGIRGNLAIAETVAEGMTNTRFLFSAPPPPPPGLPQVIIPTFGATIDFTLLWDAGINPGWTLIHFTGPSGTSANFLDLTRTTKDTLTLSFASAGPRLKKEDIDTEVRHRLSLLAQSGNTKTPSPSEAEIRKQIESEDEQTSAPSKAAAAAAAQDSVTRLLLQRIVPNP